MNRRLVPVLLCCLLLAFSMGASALAPGEPAQEPLSDTWALLDLWIEEQLSYHQWPGVAIGVVHDQELIWSAGYGVQNAQRGSSISPNTLFRIGSVSKLFTSTAILQLRDAGKLRLDDPVANHLPGFAINNPFTDAAPMTIRHLLTHTAGLPREGAFPYWTTHQFPTWPEILAAVRQQTAVHPPGEVYKYSNLGMGILGAIVSEVSGQGYAAYLDEHIFTPLGMINSTAAPTSADLAGMPPFYMRRQPGGERRQHDYYDMGGLASAGNIVSSIKDLARFAMLQFRGGEAGSEAGSDSGGEQILRGSTLRQMHRAHFLRPSWQSARGLGFSLGQRGDHDTVSHGGWIGGHRAHFLLVPDQQLAVIALTNADDVSPSFFANTVLDVVSGAVQSAAGKAATAEAPTAPPAWNGYLGTYTDPWGWQYQVLISGGRLAMYDHEYPPVKDPRAALTFLEPVSGHVFLMADGEHVTFELNAEGTVQRIQRRFEYLTPVVP